MNTFEAVDLIKHHHMILKSKLKEERLQYDFNNKELTDEDNNKFLKLGKSIGVEIIKTSLIPANINTDKG